MSLHTRITLMALGSSLAALALAFVLWFEALAPAIRQAQTMAWTPVAAVFTQVQDRGAGRFTSGLIVSYRYSVAGQEFTGHRIAEVSSNKSAVRSLPEAPASGKSCTVYVDPADPSRSVLVRGLGSCGVAPLMEVVIYTSMGLVTAAFAVFNFKAARVAKRSAETIQRIHNSHGELSDNRA